MKFTLSLIWAFIFPIVNLFFRFTMEYKPLSTHKLEKTIYIISSLFVISIWTMACIWATSMLIKVLPWWGSLLALIAGSAIYIRYVIQWNAIHRLSLKKFNSVYK